MADIIETIETDPGQSKSQLQKTCKNLLMRKSRIQKKMRTLARELRYDALDDKFDAKKIEEYQTLNKQLRRVKIFEAEFNYTMHML